MSCEYKICCLIDDKDEHIIIMKDYEEIDLSSYDCKDFSTKIEHDGVYFCDHTKSERANECFRKIIDHCLLFSEDLKVREL